MVKQKLISAVVLSVLLSVGLLSTGRVEASNNIDKDMVVYVGKEVCFTVEALDTSDLPPGATFVNAGEGSPLEGDSVYEFKWTPQEADFGKVYTTTFTVPQPYPEPSLAKEVKFYVGRLTNIAGGYYSGKNHICDQPAIYGNKVVWREFVTDSPLITFPSTACSLIKAYDILTKGESIVAGDEYGGRILSEPAVYSEDTTAKVVYRETHPQYGDRIWLKICDIFAGKEEECIAHVGGAGYPYYLQQPDIDKDKVVWKYADSLNYLYNICMYDLATRTATNITAETEMYKENTKPAIHDSNVVWQKNIPHSDTFFDIYLYDTAAVGQPSLVYAGSGSNEYQENPDIYGNYVVWENGYWNSSESRTIHSNIGIYDISTNQLMEPIAKMGTEKAKLPSINADKIVWQSSGGRGVELDLEDIEVDNYGLDYDLGSIKPLNRIELKWDISSSSDPNSYTYYTYNVKVSEDGINWEQVMANNMLTHTVLKEIDFGGTKARYLKFVLTLPQTSHVYVIPKITEINIYCNSSNSNNVDIYLYDISNGGRGVELAVTPTLIHKSPYITSGGHWSWREDITGFTNDEQCPVIYNNKIVWEEEGKIYLAVLPVEDTTPPTTPVVKDTGTYTRSTTITASWRSEDPESGIEEYEYAIGTSKGAADIVGWTRTTLTEVSRIVDSCGRYYFSVKAKNGARIWSDRDGPEGIGYSDGIKVDNIAPTIEDKTQSPQKVGQPLVFKALIEDNKGGTGITYAYLRCRIDNIYRYYLMDYNSTTKYYEGQISALSRPATLDYLIGAYDRVHNSKTSYLSLKVEDAVVNKPPVARIYAYPRSGMSPLRVRFYGYRSYDPDGKVASYYWDFGDGKTSSAKNPEYTFYNSSRGRCGSKYYTVKLTVTDDKGSTATRSIRITVYPKRRSWFRRW